MKIFRKNQLVITALAGLIAVAGYLNHVEKSGQKGELAGTEVKSGAEKEVAGSVSGDGVHIAEKGTLQEGQTENTPNGSVDVAAQGEDIQSNEIDIDSEPGEAVLVNAAGTVDFIVEAKLAREQVRAASRETLSKIIDNQNLTEEEKVLAVERMVELTEEAQKESAAENMIGAKGYKNVVVTIHENGVDVMVVAESLDDAARAQIEEIVKTKTGVTADKITITAVKNLEK